MSITSGRLLQLVLASQLRTQTTRSFSHLTGPIGGLHAKEIVAALEDTGKLSASPFIVFRDTTVAELLSSKPETLQTPAHLPETATVFEAITKMAHENIGSLLVDSKEGDGVVGVFTERDYMKKVALKGKTSRNLQLTNAMTNYPIFISPEFLVTHCLDLMTQLRVRHLPVSSREDFLQLYFEIEKNNQTNGRKVSESANTQAPGADGKVIGGQVPNSNPLKADRPIKFTGLISIGDCVKLVLEQQRNTISAFRDFASGTLYSVQTPK